MADKTLGQIAYEAWLDRQLYKADMPKWDESAELRALWEAIGSAVLDEVNSWSDSRD